MFNPHASANKNTTISKCYQKHEAKKKQAYEEHILEVEQATFTPLVFSATRGIAKQSTTFTRGWSASLLTSGNTYIPLQLNTLLAKMLPLNLPPEICHPMYQRCSPLQWLHFHFSPPNQPG